MSKAIGLFLASVAMVATSPSIAAAQAGNAQVNVTRNYEIAASNMQVALRAWARQSGQQVIYRSDDVRNARSTAIHGAYGAQAALQAILAGSGLMMRTDSSGALAVVRQPAPAGKGVTSAAEPRFHKGAQADEGASSAEPLAVQDIVVNARRRSEPLQQVPVAVTAISGADLARQAVVSLTDLTSKVPALQIMPTSFGSNIPRFVIRGQSQLEPLFALDPSVAVYFADVVQARAHGLNGALYDLSSVQVLKGPQGTLFGRNSTGGAVLLMPQAPTDQLEGYVQGEAGNYNLRSLEGAVNIPVSEHLQLRLAGRTYAHSGYTRDMNNGVDFDDANNWSLRFGAKLNLGRFTNLLYVNNFRATENGTAYKVTTARSNLANYTLGAPALAEVETAKNDPFHSTRMSIPANTALTRTFGVENTSSFEVNDNLTIKNIFGYRYVSSFSPFDFDGTSQMMYQGTIASRGRQYSDEFQITGKAFDNALDYIAGAYFFSETGNELQQLTLDYRPYFLQKVKGFAHVLNKSRSVFGQGTLHVPGLDGLSLTAGARYTWDDRHLTRQAYNNGVCAIVTANLNGTPVSPCERSASYSHGELTYTLGADWQIDRQRMVYFNTRRGYRSGGINERANLPGQFEPFQPEIVTDYELGLKANWGLGGLGSLLTNVALYHQNYHDIQRTQAQTVGVAPDTTMITHVVNAAKARINGLEADATWSPMPSVALRGYFSLTDAKYKDWLVPLIGGGIQDRSGFTFANVPKYSGGGSVTVRHDLPGSAGELVLVGDVYSQSHIQVSDDNPVPDGLAKGYHVFNGRIEWNRVLGQRVDLALWVRNLTKERYYTSGTSVAAAGLGYTVMTMGAPRTFGLSARCDF